MSVRLVVPTKEHEKDALAFKQEFFDYGETTINGSELLDQMDDYDAWLQSVTNNANVETVSSDWVLTDTFFAVDDAGCIVGIIDLRHELKVFLVDFGNSGYSVRPSQRKKGYATEMLHLIIDVAAKSGMKEMHLSVERSNTPSVKTIERNGGVYERSFEFEGEQADVYCVAIG
ncbi:MAG: GNAT family N-acetyltransferase [Eubacteriales bacterium]|nr:GNAT family N-acetyltransferase [Eubacteriales bacterium]